MGETTPAIRWFVAMAVGRADTDRIYDKHILPTLRTAGIHAVFMGRLEHNDDIDKRIIREIGNNILDAQGHMRYDWCN